MDLEGLVNAGDHELHRLGIRMARVLDGRDSTDHFARVVAEGNAAYRILHDRYADRLFSFVRDHVLHADEYQELAEDTVQTVFLQLWQRDEPTTPGVDLWGLLRCWAHDRARDIVRTYTKLSSRRSRAGDEHRRRQFNNAAAGQLDGRAGREPDPARAAENLEVDDAELAHVLHELPKHERALVEDHYLKQVPIDELIDRVQTPGEDRAAPKRRVYLILHRFRMRLRRRHSLTPASVDAAIGRLRRALVSHGIDAEEQLDALRLERQVRGDDRPLLADMLLAVSRVRKRIVKGKGLDGPVSWLNDLVFQLRLRTGAADLLDQVRRELARVEEHLRTREADLARQMRPLLDVLHARELVVVGRQLRRITGWLRGARKRGLAALADLLLELRLRSGDAAAACRGIQERLLARLSRSMRKQVRNLLPPPEETERWRRLLKLLLRVEKAKKPWRDEQVLAGVRKICGD